MLPSLLGTVVTPKTDELVADPYRHGNKEKASDVFESGFNQVFARIRRDTPTDYPITVFYAFKQAETDEGGTASTGWQVLLQGMIRSCWEITATWPIHTELGNRIKAIETNSLASSIVLACRPRPDDAPATSRRGFLAALADELPARLKELQQGSIAPVDLAQAAIGPGMAVFSRYAKVIEADGADMTVRTALALINHALDEVLSAQEGDFDVDTRFCVRWFGQFGWNEGRFGDADNLARARNTSVEGLVRGGVFRAVGGKARLLAPEELRAGWDPEADARTGVWEAALPGGPFLGVSERMSVDVVARGIFDRTRPSLSVPVDETRVSGARLVVLTVPRGATLYANAKGAATRRVGNECRPFPP